jgi:hypothetical integral membrane protein (TIGR02206 family)
MRQFSVAHFAALTVLAIACATAVVAPRRHPGRWITWAGRALAAVITAGWIGEYIAEVTVGTWTLSYSLPLQLTDAVSLAAIVALLTGRQLAVELLYYWAFSATLQAALTPDLGQGQSFPSVFYFTYFTITSARSWRPACSCSAAGAIRATSRCGSCMASRSCSP